MKKIILLVFVSILFSTAIVWGFIGPIVGHTNRSNSSSCNGKYVFASSKTIWVPDNFTLIQEAVNNACDGDTIFVRADTYYENVVVNKRVSLIGENKCNTIIDGNYSRTVIEVIANNVNITGFTTQNSGSTYPDSGIRLEGSSNNNISHNIITNNKFGIFVRYSSDNVLTDNIVSNNLHGIELMYSDENVLINNNASSNNAGVYFYGADNNMLTDNTVTNNNFGVVISHSGDNIIGNNVFSDNGWAGIRVLEQSSGNLLFNNTASGNLDGFELTYANDNTLVNNFASYNRRYGIQVAYSNSNVFVSNDVSNNVYGIRVSESSSNNTIYHNNFINNTWQEYILLSPLNTMWDKGYPSGGNYWSDYSGIDFYRGPYQNETGSDGIGDTPYIIDANNQDNYPLMECFTASHVVTIIPEFPTWTSTLLILMMLTVAIAVYKRRLVCCS